MKKDNKKKKEEIYKKTWKETNLYNRQNKCKECGGELALQGRCLTCLSCGWSVCSI